MSELADNRTTTLDEMDKFLTIHNLLKLTQDETKSE